MTVARCGHHRPQSGVAHHGAFSSGLGYVARRGTRDTRDAGGHLHRAAPDGRGLQPDDARRPGRGRWPGHRRCDRRRREHRDASRHGAEPIGRDPERHQRDSHPAHRIHDYADRRVSAAHLDYGRDRNVLQGARRHGWNGTADVPGAGVDVDADIEPLLHQAQPVPATAGCHRR